MVDGTSRSPGSAYTVFLTVACVALGALVVLLAVQNRSLKSDVSELTPDEALIVRYGRELFRDHRISDETFVAARQRFGDQGITELTATMGYYGMLACALNAFEVEPAPGTPRLP